MASGIPGLADLARAHGIQTAYNGHAGQRRQASTEGLLATLAALGVEVRNGEEVRDAMRERRLAQAREVLPPVSAAWVGRPASVRLTLPAPGGVRLACTLLLEDGETRSWAVDLAGGLTIAGEVEAEGERFLSHALPLPPDLPPGYHTLRVDGAGGAHTTRVIAAPRRLGASGERSLGLFAPVYALRSTRSWGAGDLTDLAALVDFAAPHGINVFGTLPLLAAFLDEPFEPSPYAPVSRRYWNELYVDPWANAGEAPEGLELLRTLPLVDYRAVMAAKRPVLELQAQAAFEGGEARDPDLRRFLAEKPELVEYARFRATTERLGKGWPAWPAELLAEGPRPGDYDESSCRYHQFVQWRTSEQLAAVARRARDRGAQMYLDLPVGAHRDGFDVWRDRDLFALGVNAGAPPDRLFTGGQNWGFPALKPEALRRQGYGHFIATLRHHLSVAGMLRIDHVMGLHRLYWVPEGMSAKEGVYVRYPAEELYAVLCLEAQRHGAVIVGEDLGTVPGAVRTAMQRHGILRMFVGQFNLRDDPEAAIPEAPTASVAGLNTHDMPPFAAYQEGRDLDTQVELGLITSVEAETGRTRRQKVFAALTSFLHGEGRLPAGEATPRALAAATLEHLAAGPARLVLVNLEDLWGETEPQNVPGTWRERPNWRRKLRHRLDKPGVRSAVGQALDRIAAARRKGDTG